MSVLVRPLKLALAAGAEGGSHVSDVVARLHSADATGVRKAHWARNRLSRLRLRFIPQRLPYSLLRVARLLFAKSLVQSLVHHLKCHRSEMTKTTLTDGSPVTPDHREINPATGQQKGYVVLSEGERAKGFVRPVRRSYVHNTCGTVTTMAQSLAETYARQPDFYSGTFCCGCRTHFPLDQFKWDGTDEVVGS